jgi:phage tail-like protein
MAVIPQTKRAPAFAFGLELQGRPESTWKTVSGLDISLETVDDPFTDKKAMYGIRKVPGQVSYADITLTRGFGDTSLMDWFKDVVIKGDHQKRVSGALTCYVSDRKTVIAAWDIENVWPLSVSSSDLNSASSELMIETLVLVVERIHRTK